MTTAENLAQMFTFPAIQTFVNAHSWVWPVSEMFHYVGMSLIMGFIGMLDLRILGLFKGLPIGAFRPFVPLAIAGFVANLITGLVFVTGTPSEPIFYMDNLSFQLKMTTLLLAAINLAIFQFSGLEKAVYEVPAGASAPPKAKIIAVVSLVCWVFVIFFGRLLMYNDTLLLFLGM